jgi:hypothetical protein
MKTAGTTSSTRPPVAVEDATVIDKVRIVKKSQP